MKGDSAAAVLIIVLIIIGIVALFYFYGGGFLSGFSGIISQQPIVYSNDVIQVSDKLVSDSEPYAGQKTTIEFTVRNAGDKNVKGVSVDLEPPTGFTSAVKCGEKSSCTFDLDRGDAADVVITLTAIPKEQVTQLIPVTVRYSVKYSYNGEREIHIPIVGNKNELPKGQSFFVSEPTFGPVQVQVTPPDSRQAPDGSTSVYAIGGTNPIPIELGFSVQGVGSGFYGSPEPLVMQGDDLKLVLDKNFKPLHCDNIDTEKVSGNSFPLKVKPLGTQEVGIEVPFDVKCTIEPAAQKLTDGVVKINYNYVYKISFSDIFVILPTSIPDIVPPAETGGTSVLGQKTIKDAGSASVQSANSIGKTGGDVVLTGSISKTDEKKFYKFDLELGAKYAITICKSPTGGDGPLMNLGFMLNGQLQVDRSNIGCGWVDYSISGSTPTTERVLEVRSSRGWTGDYEINILKKQEESK